MKKYLDFLKEMAINKEKLKNINRANSSIDKKSILKKINVLIEELKNILINLNFDEIKYVNKEDYIEIYFNEQVSSYLTSIYLEISKDSDISNKLIGDGYDDIVLQLELTGKFNQIDIMNGLPDFLKNIGLGKKVYKKLIKDFKYISSFVGNYNNLDSNMVWSSILQDKDIYSFTNDDNYISFWKDSEYDLIINKLKEFYKIKGKVEFDDDFLTNYKLTKKELESLIFNSDDFINESTYVISNYNKNNKVIDIHYSFDDKLKFKIMSLKLDKRKNNIEILEKTNINENIKTKIENLISKDFGIDFKIQ
jgi:hypothetical protein